MKKINKCNLCGNKDLKFLFDGYDKMYNLKGEYPVFQCMRCNLIFVNPQPNSKELAKHYPKEDYYSLEKNSNKSELKNLLQRVYYSNRKKLLKILLLPLKGFINSTKIIPGGKFLDVGCGSGDFLALMKSFNMDCYGVEPGRYDKEVARKKQLKIFNGNLEDAKYPKNYFDVITLNHVLEHVPNPTKTLKELHRILKPGGTLIIGIPQSSCWAYKIFKENWVALDIPRHLFTFSKENICKYVKKEGFKIKEIRYNSTPLQFVGSFLYWKNKNKKKPASLNEFMRNKKLMILFYLLAFPLAYICNILRIGDQMEIILKPLK